MRESGCVRLLCVTVESWNSYVSPGKVRALVCQGGKFRVFYVGMVGPVFCALVTIMKYGLVDDYVLANLVESFGVIVSDSTLLCRMEGTSTCVSL